MEIKDALDIMSSDFKLWERASSEELGNGNVAKTINLPWGIGDYTVTMEGMTDATKRRDAVGAFGAHIRGVIKDRINDEAIVGRAQVAAARLERDDSAGSDGVRGLVGILDEKLQEKPDEEAEEAYQGTTKEPTDFGDDLAARRVEINGRIERLTDELAKRCKQLRGIDAAIKAMEEDDE